MDFDIKGLFDNIDHELLLRAVRKHVTCAWALLYIERWLTAPMLQEDGTMVERGRGTPQGGVVSPILANLFMRSMPWMARLFPNLPWCRYADDGLVHCRGETEAQTVREALAARLAECRLELHPTKTRVVYCSALYPLARYINQTLAVWFKRKFKRFHRRLGRARLFLAKIARENRRLFVHWQLGDGGKLA